MQRPISLFFEISETTERHVHKNHLLQHENYRKVFAGNRKWLEDIVNKTKVQVVIDKNRKGQSDTIATISIGTIRYH